MPLQSGTRLGAYEIVAPLGAGGMGEVYRARDTRLDRTVALKILPPRFASRGELRERFEREARVVSNLNHPNICTLYDVGHHDDVAYFVMEYLDGQSLADRIAKGPLPLEQVVRYAIDIADALAKAHRHGIVHRDLKPGNVMLTPSGAKLLDFGLARRASEAPVVMADAPTVQGAALTTEGTILGTLQYMSPEQLEGHDVDARSDIFSFGAVLYEMTTGQRAFDAASHASLITRIMSGEPARVRDVAPVTPPSLERLIHRCLAKDPAARWQCAADLVAELRAIASGSADAHVEAPPKRSIVPWAIAAVLAIVAALLGAMLARRTAPSQATMRFAIPPPEIDATYAQGMLWVPFAVSPDGTRVVMRVNAAGSHLWLRTLDGEERKLDGTANAIAPFWSDDGRRIGFFVEGNLRTLDLTTGTVRSIHQGDRGGAFSASWAGDTIVLSDIGDSDPVLNILPLGGGTPRAIAKVPGAISYHYPSFLDDGRRFLFTVIEQNSTSLWVGSIDGSPPRKVAADTSRAVPVAPWLLFAREGVLYAQKFDDDDVRLEGEPVRIGSDILSYRPIGTSIFAAGGSTLVYLGNAEPSRLLWLDAQGRELGAAASPDRYEDIRVSHDGRKIAAAVVDPKSGSSDLHTIDVVRQTATRVTPGDYDYNGPMWSRDGSLLVYSADRGGPPHVYMQPAAGGAEKRVVAIGGIQLAEDVLPDGRIVFSENVANTRSDIHFVSLVDGKRTVWLQTPFNEFRPRVSPDGKWMTYCSDETGRSEVYVTTIAPGGERTRVSRNGGCRSAWAPDGRTIYYLQRNELYSTPVRIAGTTIDAGEAALVYKAAAITSFDVAPDGRVLVCNVDRQSISRPLQVVLNWQKEAEAKSASSSP